MRGKAAAGEDNTLSEMIEMRIEREIARIEKTYAAERSMMRWFVSVTSTLVLVGSAVGVYMFGSSMEEVKDNFKKTAHIYINDVINLDQKLVKDIGDMKLKFQEYLSVIEENKPYLEKISEARSLSDFITFDPYGLYLKLNDLDKINSKSGLTIEDRTVAGISIERAIEIATKGNTDPNIIFNTAIIASRLDFDMQGLKLMTLAYKAKPTKDIEINMLVLQEQFGRQFTYIDEGLVESEMSAKDVRKAAWEKALTLITEAVGPSQVQIFSQASNMAERNRNDGYISRMRIVMEDRIKSDPTSLTSYGYAIIADLVRRESPIGWEEKYWLYAKKSAELLGQESPSAPWFASSVSELSKSANSISKASEMIDLFIQNGLSAEILQKAINSGQ